MRRLGQHPHLLTFHGVARSDKWFHQGTELELHLVTELAPHGTLLDALHAFEQQGTTAVSDVVLLTLAQQARSRLLPRCQIHTRVPEPSVLFAWDRAASVRERVCSMPPGGVRSLTQSVCHVSPSLRMTLERLPLTLGGRSEATQVCEAMQFIAHRGVVHRDLAARNVLLFAPMAAADPLSVDAKVSDFGLARAVYSLKTTASGAGPGLPARYLSPEALKRNRFTEKSDVWAFGVLLWEVATLGMKPYFEMCHDYHVTSRVCEGTLRLSKPEGCSEKIFGLMASCWEARPEKRPSFRDLRRHIQDVMVELGPEAAVRRCAACVSRWRRLASLNSASCGVDGRARVS